MRRLQLTTFLVCLLIRHGSCSSGSEFSHCPCSLVGDCPVVARLAEVRDAQPAGSDRRNKLERALEDIACQTPGEFRCCPEDGGEGGTIDFLRSIRRPESRNSPSDFSDCDCVRYDDCAIVSKLVDVVAGLPKWHGRVRRVREALGTIACQSFGKFRCCRKRGPKIEDNPSLGTWKPTEEACVNPLRFGPLGAGSIARPGEFPFLALLGFKFKDKPGGRTYYLCGGSLLNKFYVLTAAHCVDSLRDGQHKLHEIVLGEYDLSKKEDCDALTSFCLPPPQRRKPQKIVFHESWDKTKFTEGNDVALVRLDRPVQMYFDEGVRSVLAPVCLPWNRATGGPGPPKTTLSVGDETTFMGWGSSDNRVIARRRNFGLFGAPSRVPNKAAFAVVDDQACVDKIPPYRANGLFFCAGGEQGEDSCGGDSGGPLVWRRQEGAPWYQFGIASYGTTHCGVGTPNVNTNVSAYLDWIDDNMQE